MIAALLGAVAALAWGLHDFIGRFATRAVGAFPVLVGVMVSGLVLLALTLAVAGSLPQPGSRQWWLAAAAGIGYLGAIGCLFAALRIGALSVVTLIGGSFPATMVLIAVIRGTPPTTLQFAAIVAVLIGAVLVVLGESSQSADSVVPVGHNNRRAALISIGSHVGFAVSLTIGQDLSAQLGSIEATALVRLIGVVALPLLLLVARQALTAPLWPSRAAALRWWPAVVGMGALDVVALLAVLAAGRFPAKELGPVVASGYGAVAVTLALIVLRERLTAVQGLGIVAVLAGTVVLSWPSAGG